MEQYLEIAKLLRKLDGRKKTYLEDYACLVEELIAINITLQLRINPNKYDKKDEVMALLKTRGAMLWKQQNNIPD
jgi:hypothetical protein